jgi:hypothetical protein
MWSRADDHGVTAEADRSAQVGRQQEPALLVHLRLDRVREHEALEEARLLVSDRQGGHLGREVVPDGLGVDRQAVVEPARHHRAGIELGAELHRDGDASLVVHRVPVLAGEHLSGLPLSSWAGGWGWGSPLLTTLRHFDAS